MDHDDEDLDVAWVAEEEGGPEALKVEVEELQLRLKPFNVSSGEAQYCNVQLRVSSIPTILTSPSAK